MTMTATATGQPAGAPPPQPPAARQVALQVARATFEGTPGRMRLYGALAVLGCLIFGVFAFIAASSRSSALSNARSDAAQLVRVQAIRTNLVFADANLTNAFLVGGLEPPAARAAYQQGIATASTTLAEASGVNSHDAAVLAKVNDVITRYTGLVESARANNRLGFPLGAAYLRQATNLLRTDALPPLEDLGKTEQARIAHSYSASAHAMYWLVAGLVVALAVLIVTQVWLAGRTRRLFNLPLVDGNCRRARGRPRPRRADGVESEQGQQDPFQRLLRHGRVGHRPHRRVRRQERREPDPDRPRIRRRLRRELQQSRSQRRRDLEGRRGPRRRERASRARRRSPTTRTCTTDIRAADNSGDWDGAVAIATGTKATDANAVFAKFNDASATGA